MRVLVVEDEVILAESIQSGLRREAMAVDAVHDGLSALDQLSVNGTTSRARPRPAGMHGDDLCRAIINAIPRLAGC